MNKTDWLSELKSAGAVWEYPGVGPHARYALSDNHTDFYFNSEIVVKNKALLNQVCDYILAAVPALNASDVVASFATASVSAGCILAETLAGRIGKQSSCLNLDDGSLSFPLSSGEKVSVVTDDIHSGGSLHKLVAAIQARGAVVAGPIVTIANFSGEDVFDGEKVMSLFNARPSRWAPDKCPLCASGSVAVDARTEWEKLTSGAVDRGS